MLNTAQRRQALLNIFDKHEEMVMLLCCLPRSPALWDEEEDEQQDIKNSLVDRGFLKRENGYVTTTPEGCEALIAYVLGEDCDESDDDPTSDNESED